MKGMEKKISYVVQAADIPCTVEFLMKNRLGLSKAQIKSAKFRRPGISINGRQVRVTNLVQTGDFLEVFLEGEEDSGQEMEAAEEKLDILYEDEDLILVNKAAGVAVHPGHGHFKDTLANHLLYYFQQQEKKVTIRAVGRLDKDTSGIVIFAKNKVAAARLTGRLAGEVHTEPWLTGEASGVGMKKEYLALVQGHLEEKRGCIEFPIRKEPGQLNKMEVWEKGSFARTHYQVLEEYEKSSLVRLWLDTGRTHQIRVHMAALGHPLVGDPIYGVSHEKTVAGERAVSGMGQSPITRAALHCGRVELVQPFTGEWIIREASLPEDMQNAVGMK